MNVRVLAAVLLTLVVGAAVGWAVGTRDEPRAAARTSYDGASPVAASGPAIPVEVFRPDPDDAPLEPGIELRTVTLTGADADGEPTGSRLSVPVPQGWEETRIGPSEWKYTVPGNEAMSYVLRIEIIAERGQTVESAVQSRQGELSSALAQGSFEDLDVELDADGRGFVAEIVQDGYRRFAIERFFDGPDPDLAYANVAVSGRERDVTGMTDLLSLISRDQRAVQKP